MEEKSLGATQAQIFKISTIIDGSVRITLDLNPTEHELIANLMKKKLSGIDSVYVAFVDTGH